MLFAICVNAGFIALIAWAIAHMVRTRRQRRSHPRDLIVSTRAGLAMGSMLLGFQALVQPAVRHVIVEQQKEDRDDEGNDEEEPPGGRLLHQQLRKIRRGEEVDCVTLRIDAVDGVTPARSTTASSPTPAAREP